MKPIVLVAAMDATGAIGRSNEIPWHIPGEQKRFKELNMGKPLILGRMTCASLPRPLPGRHCIVLSRTAADDSPNVHSAASVEEALSLASALPGSEITIGGGQQIYELFLPLADRIHLAGGICYISPDISVRDDEELARVALTGDIAAA